MSLYNESADTGLPGFVKSIPTPSRLPFEILEGIKSTSPRTGLAKLSMVSVKLILLRFPSDFFGSETESFQLPDHPEVEHDPRRGTVNSRSLINPS